MFCEVGFDLRRCNRTPSTCGSGLAALPGCHKAAPAWSHNIVPNRPADSFGSSYSYHSLHICFRKPCIAIIRSSSTPPSCPPPNRDSKARIRRSRENSVMQAAPVRNAHSHEGLPAGGEASTSLARPCRSFVIFKLPSFRSLFPMFSLRRSFVQSVSAFHVY
jgi:hypothetical protein